MGRPRLSHAVRRDAPKILDGTYTSGLIIHEGQLTYVEHDLDVLVDLGIWWNEKTGGLPMPLGGNV